MIVEITISSIMGLSSTRRNKLNVDAAVKDRTTATGVIARNNKGSCGSFQAENFIDREVEEAEAS